MDKAWQGKKLVAWGRSKLLQMHQKHHPLQFEFCVDENTKVSFDIPIVSPSEADLSNAFVVIFAVSNAGLNAIRAKLTSRNLSYGKDFIFYADLYLEEMKELALTQNFEIQNHHHLFAKSFTLNSIKPVHTTITGSAILLGILETLLRDRTPNIAEVGSFEGGNVYSMMQFLAARNAQLKNYFVFDSFEGFPDLSIHDPSKFEKGSYKTQRTFQDIKNDFEIFENVKVIKGFVPQTFSQLDQNQKFDLVFYDCDLYKPAIDTLEYFWNKMNLGGYIVLHDYVFEAGGFGGVEKGVTEFLSDKSVKPTVYWPSTMAILRR